MENEKKGFLSRRGILKAFGLAGAAVVTSPILHAGESALRAATGTPGSTTTGLKIGLLLPDSSSREFSSSFLNGFNLSLNESKRADGSLPFSYIVEEFGTVPASTKLQKLVMGSHINIVVGLLNSKVAAPLANVVKEANIRFIEANLGENFFNKDLVNDNFVHSSMNLWQSHYVLGQYAAKNIGKTAVCATSFFDSGYDALYAFTSGFESEGGKITNTYISGSPNTNLSPVEAAALAASDEASFVFANYSDHEATIFMSAFKNTTHGQSKQVVASGMMIQPRVLRELGVNAIGMIGASTYAADGSQHSAEFAARYRAAYGSEADDFAVLGYDTAKMIEVKNNASFISARGEQRASAATHVSEAPIYIIKMARPDDGHIVATINMPNAITNADFRLVENEQSGFVHSYPMN